MVSTTRIGLYPTSSKNLKRRRGILENLSSNPLWYLLPELVKALRIQHLHKTWLGAVECWQNLSSTPMWYLLPEFAIWDTVNPFNEASNIFIKPEYAAWSNVECWTLFLQTPFRIHGLLFEKTLSSQCVSNWPKVAFISKSKVLRQYRDREEAIFRDYYIFPFKRKEDQSKM